MSADAILARHEKQQALLALSEQRLRESQLRANRRLDCRTSIRKNLPQGPALVGALRNSSDGNITPGKERKEATGEKAMKEEENIKTISPKEDAKKQNVGKTEPVEKEGATTTFWDRIDSVQDGAAFKAWLQKRLVTSEEFNALTVLDRSGLRAQFDQDASKNKDAEGEGKKEETDPKKDAKPKDSKQQQQRPSLKESEKCPSFNWKKARKLPVRSKSTSSVKQRPSPSFNWAKATKKTQKEAPTRKPPARSKSCDNVVPRASLSRVRRGGRKPELRQSATAVGDESSSGNTTTTNSARSLPTRSKSFSLTPDFDWKTSEKADMDWIRKNPQLYFDWKTSGCKADFDWSTTKQLADFLASSKQGSGGVEMEDFEKLLEKLVQEAAASGTAAVAPKSSGSVLKSQGNTAA